LPEGLLGTVLGVFIATSGGHVFAHVLRVYSIQGERLCGKATKLTVYT
jgi:hypothetical protein